MIRLGENFLDFVFLSFLDDDDEDDIVFVGGMCCGAVRWLERIEWSVGEASD